MTRKHRISPLRESESMFFTEEMHLWSPRDYVPVFGRISGLFLSLAMSSWGGGGLSSAGIHRNGDAGLGDRNVRKTSLWLLVCESLATGTLKACWEYNPGFIFFLNKLC